MFDMIVYWQVIFSALDTRVKNVVFNYSLEHNTTDDLFTSIFHWLHVLEEERGNIADVLREVVLCIGTILSSICQHMLKEERQVYIQVLLVTIILSSITM